MKKLIILALAIISINALSGQTDETNDYVEFDDRKNVVHGVYIGIGGHYGKKDDKDLGLATIKLVYVANRQLEVGLVFTGFTGFYNYEPNPQTNQFDGDKVFLSGGYGGFHIEPILFGDRLINISFPALIGGGLVTDRDLEDEGIGLEEKDVDSFFIVEPGINILYNFSRFTQLETGFRYRFTSDYDFSPFKSKDNLNGYSIMIGLKLGIFNIGRKKKIKDNF